MNFAGTKSSPKILLLLKYKNVQLASRPSNYYNVSSWRNTLIKLTCTMMKQRKGLMKPELNRSAYVPVLMVVKIIWSFKIIYNLIKITHYDETKKRAHEA